MEEDVRSAVLAGCPECASEVAEYLADTAASLLEDAGGDAEAFREGLVGALPPFLEDFGVAAEAAEALCERVALAAFPAKKSGGGVGAPGKEAAEQDLLCRLPNLLMMYGGSNQPLLKNATLEFVRGHRYGVVGTNGSGKTTLMRRIAKRDLAGFPQAIRVVHLSHDTLVQGVDPSTSARDFAQAGGGLDAEGASGSEVLKALRDVGFDDDLLGKAVSALSGGWQMRLALACAVTHRANLLLLDEPTNHLDTAGVQWLVDFLNSRCVGGEAGGTAMIISHDASFLDKVCTDVVHFTAEGKLSYHPGNFSAFKGSVLKGDEAAAERLLETKEASSALGVGLPEGGAMAFPNPDKIGMTSAARKAPVLTLQNASFWYEDGDAPVLKSVDIKLSMEDRIAIVGKNGAGKSTLLALMADRLKPRTVAGAPPGELWWNKQLRLAYVAQQHLTHLGECLKSTPMEYMQARFLLGWDSETPQKEARELNAEEEADRKRNGMKFGKKGRPVKALLSRREQLRHAAGNAGEKEYVYQVQWEDLPDTEASWEDKGKLEKCGAGPMRDDLDERLWQAWAGVEQRPLSQEEILGHLEQFGLDPEIGRSRKIAMLSSGQKVKLMFAAAFWTRPHVLCLDEPTNYLDPESVQLLQDALKAFKGGYAIVTHNEAFAAEVCSETWTVADGQITGQRRIWGNAKAKAKPEAKAKPKPGKGEAGYPSGTG